MVDIKTLKQLQRITNAGLSDCKRALEDADGDVFTAATSMLTEEDALEMQQSMRVRAMAGQSIKDPVTEDEERFVDNLVAHFIAGRTRPGNVGFLFELTRLFCDDSVFRDALQHSPLDAIRRFQNVLDPNGEFPGTQSVETHDTGNCISTVIQMPTSQSEWECDFVVLQHPKKGLFRKRPARIFAVYKRTNRNDRGIANVQEMATRSGETGPVAGWVHEDLEFRSERLANVSFEPNLRKLN